MTFDIRGIKFWQGESTRGYFQVEVMSKFLAGGGGGGDSSIPPTGKTLSTCVKFN